MDPNPSLLRQKLGVGGSSQLYGTGLRVRFMVECIPAFPTHFEVLSTQCAEVTGLVSGFFSEGIALCVVVHSVCPRKEGSSGAFYHSLCPSS